MRQLRYILEPKHLTEIICRSDQGRSLFKPSTEFNRLFTGVLGRAQELYDIKIFGYAVLANRYHLLLQLGELRRQAEFMKYLNTNLSKEVGRLYNFFGPKFQRPFTSHPISNEPAAQIYRLKCLLSQGTEDKLIDSPLDCPGVHCARALITGQNDSGVWFDRTRQRTERHQRGAPTTHKLATYYDVELSPIPCWAHYSSKEYRGRIAELVKNIEDKAKEVHRMTPISNPSFPNKTPN